MRVRKQRMTSSVKGDRFDRQNDPWSFADELSKNNMTWEESGKFGTLRHEPSGQQVIAEIDERSSYSYKRYLINKLIDKVKCH